MRTCQVSVLNSCFLLVFVGCVLFVFDVAAIVLLLLSLLAFAALATLLLVL